MLNNRIFGVQEIQNLTQELFLREFLTVGDFVDVDPYMFYEGSEYVSDHCFKRSG